MIRAACPVLILIFGATISLWGLVHIRMDNDDVIRWLPDHSTARQEYDFFRQHFSTDEYVYVTWAGCTINDFRLDRFCEILIQDSEGQHLVNSATSGREIVDDSKRPAGVSSGQLQRRLSGTFFGRSDLDNTCVVIALSDSGRQRRPESIAFIETALERAGVTREDRMIAGYPWVAVNMSRMIESTFSRLLVWSGLAATLLALVCLRDLWLAIACLIAGGLGAGFSIGLAVLLTGSLGGLTMIVPTIAFVLTMSGGLHLSQYARNAPGDHAALLKSAWRPCTISVVTTIVGMLTLLSSNYPAVREFAVLSAGSLLFSLVLQLGFLPWAISQYGARSAHSPPGIRNSVVGERAGFGTCRSGVPLFLRWSITIAAVLVFALASSGIHQLVPNVEAENLFPANSVVLSGIARIESTIGPMDTTEVLLVFDHPDERKFVERMNYVRQTAAYLQRLPEVDRTLSLPDFLPFVGGGWKGQLFREAMIRRRGELQDSGLLRLADDREIWRISLRFPFLAKADFSEMRERVERLHREIAAASAKQWDGFRPPRMVYTGATHLVHSAQESLLGDFAFSFGLAFAIITPILILTLRSFWLGCVGMLANLWPVVLVFGGLGWMRIPVDIALGMSASVALGIAVDDTTHFLMRIRDHEQRPGATWLASIRGALTECGPAMASTTLIACAGIATFGFSELTVIARFALVISAMLVAALVADAVVLPAALSLQKR